MTLNYVNLLITSQDAGQDASSGTVSVQPTSAVTASGVTVVSPVPVIRQLSGGAVTISLVACDNSGTIPAPGFWAYQITLPGEPVPRLVAPAFAGGSSQRLDSLTPVVASTTYGRAAPCGVTSVNGHTGTVVLAAADVGADASGAAATVNAALTTEVGRATAAEAAKVARAGDTMGGKLAPAVVTLTDAAPVAIDASQGNDWRLLLTSAVGGTRVIGAPSNPADGQQVVLALTQPASGGPCAVTWASGAGGYAFSAAGAPVLSTAANAADLIGLKYYGGSVQRWRVLPAAAGY